MFCFINLTPQTPPSVIHGWKATDLLYEMVKTKKIFLHPVKRQIFGDAPKQTFYMISKLVLIIFPGGETFSLEHSGDLTCGIPDGETIVMIGGYDHNYVTRSLDDNI